MRSLLHPGRALAYPEYRLVQNTLRRAPREENAVFVPGNSRAWLRLPFRHLLGLFLAAVPASCVLAATFSVNSLVDVVDANPGDGICRTAPNNTVCTLRAAIMEANATAGADTINLQANATYMLELPGTDDAGLNGDLDVLDSVTIVGAGATSTIIDGNGLVVGDRIMTVFKCIGSAGAGDCLNGANIVATISGVGFRHGRAVGGSGGGLANLGLLTIHDCAFTENFAVIAGGIVSNGTLDISNSTVAGNEVALFAAGIFAGGVMRMVDTTVRDNGLLGDPAPEIGGGIVVASGGTATIKHSTISNNRAGNYGGGIYVESATLNLVNTTLSDNVCNGIGGGLAVISGTAGLYNVTIADNIANRDQSGPADFGGGVYRETGTLTLRNSILTSNLHLNAMGPPSNDDCFGGLTSAGNNIVTFVNGQICSITGSFAAVGASLGPLQNNGGPTQTRALLAGSLAIDAGNPAGCTDNVGAILATDQRGVPRPSGPACDIGAFEDSDGVFKDGFES